MKKQNQTHNGCSGSTSFKLERFHWSMGNNTKTEKNKQKGLSTFSWDGRVEPWLYVIPSTANRTIVTDAKCATFPTKKTEMIRCLSSMNGLYSSQVQFEVTLKKFNYCQNEGPP